MTLLVIDIAQHIRRIDGGNKMPARELGRWIAHYLNLGGITVSATDPSEAVSAYVDRVNPNKRMGAGRLAELICAEFNLPEEGAEQ